MGVRSIFTKIKFYTYRRFKKISNFSLSKSLAFRSVDKVLSKFNRSADAKLAVVIHLYYVDNWQLFKQKIGNLNSQKFDLFITIPKHNLYFEKEVKKDFPEALVIVVPNHGRDVLPFISVAKVLYELGYIYVLKFHSKKSTHRNDGQDWLEEMLNKILPDNDNLIRNIITILDSKSTGLVGPSGVYYPLTINFPANGVKMTNILNKIYNKSLSNDILQVNRSNYGFFGGTMFWARLDAIKSLLDVSWYDFDAEAGQIDGTTAHALERLFVVVPEIDNKDIYEVDGKSVNRRSYVSDNIPSWSEDHLK